MEKICYCCAICVESEKHECDKNTLKFDDIKKENNLDENIYEIDIQYCQHDEILSQEKKVEISYVFKGWYFGYDCDHMCRINNFPYMLEKGYFKSSYDNNYVHAMLINSFGQYYCGVTSFKRIVDNIKIGSLITLNCNANGSSYFSKFISDRFWKLKKIGINDTTYRTDYVVVEEELVTKVALK